MDWNIVFIVIIVINVAYFIYHSQNKSSRILNPETVKPSAKEPMEIKDCYLHKENGNDSIALSELIRTGPILVLRLPHVSCQQCVFEELENFKELIDSESNIKGCVILSLNTPRDIKALKLTFNYDFCILGIDRFKNLSLNTEKQNRPYYFILGPDMKISMPFFPDVKNMTATKNYIKEVRKFYFN